MLRMVIDQVLFDFSPSVFVLQKGFYEPLRVIWMTFAIQSLLHLYLAGVGVGCYTQADLLVCMNICVK